MRSRAEYIRAAEIAKLVSVSTRTVRRWIADEITPSVKIGGARLVLKADLERLLSPSSSLTEEDVGCRR
jgi:excisionase family DNA binding protein